MDDREAIVLLRSLVETPSPSGDESAAATLLCAHMHRLGLRDVHIDDAGNVIGETGDPNGTTLLLLGHIDTVPGDITVRQVGNVLYGRGCVDAKGPLAAFVGAAARHGESLPIRVVVAAAVDEERASAGAQHLVRHMQPPAAVVIGEPSGADNVVLGYKGVYRFRVDVTQPPSHTSSPQPTAVERAASLWGWILDHFSAAGPQTPQFDQVTPTLIRLEGGLEQARMDISCRVPLDFAATEFRALLASKAGDASLTEVEQVPAVRSPRTDPLCRTISAAIRRHGRKPTSKVKLGTSDMNLVVPVWRVPAVAYGPGDSHFCHSADEHIDLREYLGAMDVLTDALGNISAALAPAGGLK